MDQNQNRQQNFSFLKIQKSPFSAVLWTHTVLQIIYVILQETKCNCCAAAYLFTYCCLLLSIICIALFCGQFSLVSHFVYLTANPQPALFRATNISRNATLPSVRCKSFAFYKVVWWHFSGVTFQWSCMHSWRERVILTAALLVIFPIFK